MQNLPTARGQQHPTNIPKPPQINHMHLIYQLKLENDMLKKQISTLITHQDKTNSHQNHHHPAIIPQYIQVQPLKLMEQPSNMEDQIQVTYRNKISKLKMKKSPSKRMQTTPNSPGRGQDDTNRLMPQQIQNYHNRDICSPRNKMMVISKDKHGKYFRVKPQEATVTSNNTKQPSYVPYQHQPKIPHPYQQHPQTSQQNEKSKFIPGHQRASSNTEPQYQNFQEYNEKAHQTFNIQKNVKKEQPYKPHNYKSISKYQLSESRDVLVKKGMSAKVQHPIIPKGNIYFEAPQYLQECQKKANMQNSEQTEDRGDSQLSIQMNLRKMRSKRTLKCDIYLCDERG